MKNYDIKLISSKFAGREFEFRSLRLQYETLTIDLTLHRQLKINPSTCLLYFRIIEFHFF